MPTVRSVDDVAISFEVAGGGGRPIVFVHGWSCDRTYWRHQMPWFARGHQVVAIDLGGHGESGTARSSWTMRSFGEDVASVLDALGARDAVLVGHSMGGDVIVETALVAPDRVGALIWIDVYRTLGEPAGRDEIEAFATPFRRDFRPATQAFVRRLFRATADADLVDAVASDMSAAPPEIAVDALEHAFGNEGAAIEGLRALSVPVVAINPDDGRTDAAALARFGVETVLMPGVGHFPMLERPDEFNAVLASTIGRLARR